MTVLIGTLIIISLFLWEHIANVNNFTIRPTWPLSKLIILSRKTFYYIGILFGRIGSLITYLHLDKLFDTIYYITKLFFDLITSVKYVGHGIAYVSSLFKNMYKQVYTASWISIATTIVVLIMCITIYLNPQLDFSSSMDYIEQHKDVILSSIIISLLPIFMIILIVSFIKLFPR